MKAALQRSGHVHEGSIVMRKQCINPVNARKPTFIRVVEIRALTGGGATECASIVTVCMGNKPIFVLNPIRTNKNAIFRYIGLAWLIKTERDEKVRLAASSLP